MMRIELKKEKGTGGMRLKMPKGRGWHTSFWMMQIGPKPGMDDRYQEIDVVEQDSVDASASSANWHSYKPHTCFGVKRITMPDVSTDYHIYGADFTPSGVRFYFDGQMVHTIDTSAMPHNPQHIRPTSIASSLHRTMSVDEVLLLRSRLLHLVWLRCPGRRWKVSPLLFALASQAGPLRLGHAFGIRM